MKRFLIIILCFILILLIVCCGFLIYKNITLESKINMVENMVNLSNDKIKNVETIVNSTSGKLDYLIKKLGYNPLSYEWTLAMP